MFIHKCFIRKNNEVLRETLKKLGYVELNPNDNGTIIVTSDGHGTSYFTTIEESSIASLIVICPSASMSAALKVFVPAFIG